VNTLGSAMPTPCAVTRHAARIASRSASDDHAIGTAPWFRT